MLVSIQTHIFLFTTFTRVEWVFAEAHRKRTSQNLGNMIRVRINIEQAYNILQDWHQKSTFSLDLRARARTHTQTPDTGKHHRHQEAPCRPSKYKLGVPLPFDRYFLFLCLCVNANWSSTCVQQKGGIA